MQQVIHDNIFKAGLNCRFSNFHNLLTIYIVFFILKKTLQTKKMVNWW